LAATGRTARRGGADFFDAGFLVTDRDTVFTHFLLNVRSAERNRPSAADETIEQLV
jgi:hypothetical protein